MSNIHQLKRRISSAKNISKITKAMEMVAASKMKKAQEQAIATRPYSRALTNSLQMLAARTEAGLHPLLQHHDSGVPVAIVISTDKGLCGGLNTNLFKAAVEWMKQHKDGKFIMVGKKAVTFAQIYGLPLHAQFTEMPDAVRTSDLLPISSLLMEGFLSNEFASVQLIYTDFINTLSQLTRSLQLLPMTATEVVADPTMEAPMIDPMYMFEPNPTAILEELLPYYVENTLYQALLEAKASEHSARMVAMKNASENAGELMDELQLVFNKTRQENITSELLDISTASLTLN
jgi:F-type H+-transporting ATPase subunit gamma